MVTEATIRHSLETYCEAFTRGDRDAWTAHFADDAWIEDPVGTPTRHGKAAIAQFFDETQSRYDSVALVLGKPIIVAGQEVAFRMQGHPVRDGHEYDVAIINVMSFDGDGNIATMRAFFDASHRK